MAKGKVCLAYSGGLDTSCILAWLKEQGHDVVCYCADVGQEEDFAAVKSKALKIGAASVHIIDLKREFVEQLCYPAIACNAIYESVYLLGTSLARPVIARAQIELAKKEGCFAVAHGCTGKGNDQVRFELAYYALQPGIKVIAPWRDASFYNRFAGRQALLDYAAEQGIPVTSTKAAPWSMDENMAHCSYEAGMLEDPDTTPREEMWKLTKDPTKAPDEPEDFTLYFEKGLPSKLEYTEGGKKQSVTESVALFLKANEIARRNGVGRIDIVENRFIGLKSRGCYETPGFTMLRQAHMDLEGLVLDREVRALRDQFVTVGWSKALYNGTYFSPERKYLETCLHACQANVEGYVRMRAYKGASSILGRKSDKSILYSESESSMDTVDDFSVEATTGFIDVTAIRLKKYGGQRELIE